MKTNEQLRHEYDAAEYGLIAARASRSRLQALAESKSWNLEGDETLALRASTPAGKEAERALGEAREACEAHGVVINAHPALVLL